MDAFKSLSDSVSALASRASSKLFHVPSSLGGRTALGFDGKLLLVPASDAEAGESLSILAPGGSEVAATVKGFDPSLGLAVLELSEALPDTAWTAAPALPAIGSLVLVAAYPSPEGAEVRLDAVRFSGGEAEGASEDAYIQTDGAPFPGFSGAALVDPELSLTGFLLGDKGGNRGWALPGFRASALVAAIASGQHSARAWLGVSTVPIETPPELASSFGDQRASALLVAGVVEGSPAAAAGIRVGDVLVSLGGNPVAEPADLVAALEAAKPGEPLPIVLLRSGERKELTAVPEARPREGGERDRGWRHHQHGQGPRGPWWMGGGRCGWAPGR